MRNKARLPNRFGRKVICRHSCRMHWSRTFKPRLEASFSKSVTVRTRTFGVLYHWSGKLLEIGIRPNPTARRWDQCPKFGKEITDSFPTRTTSRKIFSVWWMVCKVCDNTTVSKLLSSNSANPPSKSCWMTFKPFCTQDRHVRHRSQRHRHGLVFAVANTLGSYYHHNQDRVPLVLGAIQLAMAAKLPHWWKFLMLESRASI